MNQKIDAELVALARCGNKAAFSHFIKRHRTLALRVAQKMMSRNDIAQELVQEAFLQAYLALHRASVKLLLHYLHFDTIPL